MNASDSLLLHEAAGDGQIVIGVDEAGRGPLAGPVVAAAVILCDGGIQGLDDSKKLSARKRALLEAQIKAQCRWGVGVVEPADIDRINILQATMLAMSRAVEALAVGQDVPCHILVDGNRLPQWRWSASAVIGGDALHPCISAASIIAKEHRDRIMIEAAQTWPQYGWDSNKGYGSAAHMAALREHGPTPLHRRSFAPVAQAEMRF